MDRELEVLAAAYGNTQWINSFVAKGPLVIEDKGRPGLVIVDKKTQGYPFEKWVGRYILTGGNWRKFPDGTVPATPLMLYKRQLKEELEKNWPGRLMPAVIPLADYFEVTRVEDHGNKREDFLRRLQATNGTVCTLVSVIGSTIEKEELQDGLKVSSAELTPSYLLGRIRSRDVGELREPGLAVLTIDDLYGDAMKNFAAGNNVMLSDFFEHVYEIKIPTAPTNGRAFKLSSSPRTAYANRTELLRYLSVNPLTTETTAQSPFR